MRSHEAESAGRRLFVWVMLVSVVVCLLAVAVFDHGSAHDSLLELANLVGPTTASLLAGHGLTTCTEMMGTPGNPICFHGGRMPVPTLVVALGMQLLGDHLLLVAVMKTLLLLLPLELAIYLACGGLGRTEGRRRWVGAALLLAPFAMTGFLADVVNLQVEEGYSYSFLALATAVVLFRGVRRGWLRADGPGEAVVFGFAVAGLYLSKSSMAPVAALLTIGYVLRARGTKTRALAVVLALAAPVGWTVYQHRATGRYSLGTSIDGLNLRKGNDEGFLGRYPPLPGETLDGYDTVLNAGVHFEDEWSFNDFHQRAAVRYMETHPGETARGELRKVELILFSVHKVGSGASHGGMRWIEIVGMVVFRVIFWAAVGLSVVSVVREWRGLRWEGAMFLLVVGAVALPYVVGFAYTRHISVLIYPSVLLCCRVVAAKRNQIAGSEGLH